MQASMPELVDFSHEPEHIFTATDLDVVLKRSLTCKRLIAKGLLERSARFIKKMHARWDQHNHLDNELEAQCHDSRGISATLVHDLKDR